MSWPAPQHWLFSVKTFIAGMMALSIGFWFSLPRPYWALATVYIVSHPLSGATRSKAVYRVAGTLIGATIAVAMVPNLVNAPALLVLALSLWLAACLYLSLLDRSPRGYTYMLAGYTAALIGFPAVNAPGTMFDVALARSEEILLGITCAAIVSSIVFPRSVGPVVAQRVRAWLADADASIIDALNGGEGGQPRGPREMHRLRLAGDIATIDNLASHLAFDASADRPATRWVGELHPRMLMLLPVLSSLSDRMRELAKTGGPSLDVAALVERMRAWLADDAPAGDVGAETLRVDLESRIAASRFTGSWNALVELTVLMRLRDVLDIRSDCRALSQALQRGSATLSALLVFPAAMGLSQVRHYDHGIAFLSALAAFSTMLACCGFWIATSWPEGDAAAMMAAVLVSLFAAQDNPVPAIVKFAGWSVVAMAITGIYLFGILPHAHGIETLIIALAPAFITFGLLMAIPERAIVGLALAINMGSLMALQELTGLDIRAFINSGLATIWGIALAAAVTAMVRTVGAEWSVARLARSNRSALAEAANVTTPNEETRVAGLMFDRLVLLAPRAPAAGHTMPDAMNEIRAGFNIIDLHRARARVSAYVRRRIDAVLLQLTRHYRSAEPEPGQGLLAAIDRALLSVKAEDGGGEREAVLGLVGLRRCLFPECPPTLAAAAYAEQ